MHQSLQGATFHIEHVIPRIRGGTSELDNLALACPSCNLPKADRVSSSPDHASGAIGCFIHAKTCGMTISSGMTTRLLANQMLDG